MVAAVFKIDVEIRNHLNDRQRMPSFAQEKTFKRSGGKKSLTSHDGEHVEGRLTATSNSSLRLKITETQRFDCPADIQVLLQMRT